MRERQTAGQDLSDRVDRRNPTGQTRPEGRAWLRIAGLLEDSPAFRFWTPRRLNGGCECPWVRNKGGGVGRKADAGGHSHPRALAPAPSHSHPRAFPQSGEENKTEGRTLDAPEPEEGLVGKEWASTCSLRCPRILIKKKSQ